MYTERGRHILSLRVIGILTNYTIVIFDRNSTLVVHTKLCYH